MGLIKRKTSFTISISIIRTNKYTSLSQGLYLQMDNSSNFNIFLEFLKQNFNEYKNLAANYNRVDWKGNAIKEASSTINVNIFFRELEIFLENKFFHF